MIGVLRNSGFPGKKLVFRETGVGKGLGDHVWSLMQRYCLQEFPGSPVVRTQCFHCSGPQPFWQQGPILWRTVFPQTGAGMVQVVMRAMGSRQMKLRSLARTSFAPPAVWPGS